MAKPSRRFLSTPSIFHANLRDVVLPSAVARAVHSDHWECRSVKGRCVSMESNGVQMKRIFLVLSFLLTACTQETPFISTPILITETSPVTLPPTVMVEEVTSIPATELLA